VTGTGYNAGIEILRGSITAGSSGSFLNSTFIDPVTFPVTGLDQFGADDAAGVQSVRGSGQSTIRLTSAPPQVASSHLRLLPVNITSLTVDAVDTGQLVAPFFAPARRIRLSASPRPTAPAWHFRYRCSRGSDDWSLH
jgi:hypothetical protein